MKNIDGKTETQKKKADIKKTGRGRDFFSSPLHPDLLWGPPNLLSNGQWGFSPGSKAADT
jgi:hypothetical protein